MKQAIGYIRVSTEKQANEGVSLEAQEAKIVAWCKANGYELVKVYVDAGISGKRMDTRKELLAALAFAEAGAAPAKTGAKQAAAEKRAFFAPEGYRRLTINLPEALHKKLRLAAVEQDCTATEIIERLLVKELGN